MHMHNIRRAAEHIAAECTPRNTASAEDTFRRMAPRRCERRRAVHLPRAGNQGIPALSARGMSCDSMEVITVDLRSADSSFPSRFLTMPGAMIGYGTATI